VDVDGMKDGLGKKKMDNPDSIQDHINDMKDRYIEKTQTV
jgi:hypothetical protein